MKKRPKKNTTKQCQLESKKKKTKPVDLCSLKALPQLRKPSRTRREKSEWRQLRFVNILGLFMDEYKDMSKTEELIYSEYEGYALYLKELENLWMEIKKEPAKRDVKKIRKCAARVGAISIRYINSLTGLK
jgi:hypothetical protein